MAKDKDNKLAVTPKKSSNSNTLAKRIKRAEDQSVNHAHKFIIRRWKSMTDVRQYVIVWFLLIGLLTLMAGVQLVWYRSGYTTAVPANDTIYTEGALGPVETMNPLFANSSAEQALSKLIFSQPMQYDTTGNLGYDLLSNLEIDETETVYTLTMKKESKWHDGQSVTADDLIYTIDLLKNPAVKANSSTVWNNVEVKKVNDYTVEFKLPSPYAPFKHYFTFPVLPKHILVDIPPAELRESDFGHTPVGSGPFQFKLLQEGDVAGSSSQAAYLVRNDNYYAGKPSLSRFQMLIYDSQDNLLNAVKNNEVNGLADLIPSQLSKIDQNRYTVHSEPTQGGVYLLFNTTAPNLDNIKMRQALRAGIDTDKLRQNISDDMLEDLYLPVIDSAKLGLKKPKYNPDTTKVYLSELGWHQEQNGTWKKGDEELRFKLAVIKNPELELVADEIARQLNDLGVKTDTQILDLENVDQGALQNILQPREFDLLINRINIGADPDVYSYWHSSQATKNGLNFSNYKNVVADDALASARNKRNPELREAKYKTFAHRWLEDVPAVGLYQTSANYVNLKSARSFGDDVEFVSPISRYSDVIYWSSGKRSVYKTP